MITLIDPIRTTTLHTETLANSLLETTPLASSGIEPIINTSPKVQNSPNEDKPPSSSLSNVNDSSLRNSDKVNYYYDPDEWFGLRHTKA
jgi:hypothetical protein